MRWTSLNDLREKYLCFFESKGHLRLPSFSLIPRDDKSLLLINSGMAPMKKFFTGEEKPPRSRVTTCQKCIRTPDLERVGHTARHGTFFEMLGNFSFGDYFKEQAIKWAWEFLTDCLEIPAEKLMVSVYEKDDESYNIWKNVVKVPEERIVRLGKEDNFWEHGSGPCGPCSEIYFDRGEKYGCGRPDCKPGCECDRYMEIWNNVFSQFNNDGCGNYSDLVQKNIDTGMGLERLACVMQGVGNMFEVDGIRKILDEVCLAAKKKYGEKASDDISIRVCTDHVKSAMFMIADGVIPSNEGRGYVLRRIIRRACRHGKLLGINRPFLADLCRVAVAESVRAYPELDDKKEYILKVISVEEERFDATVDQGLSKLAALISDAKDKKEKTLSGEEVFKLYDTYGFPIDLTREIAAESGMTLDEEKFGELMRDQRERARGARAAVSGWDNTRKTLLSDIPKTKFEGYEKTSADGEILAIIRDGALADSVGEGDFSLVLDKTAFYGEGGGQIGDTGVICGKNGRAAVTDTKKTDGIYIHLCTMTEGSFKKGEIVTAGIDEKRRKAVMRNHSACHLLQAALREVLGKHVEQAGSYVSDRVCRFDFTHFSAMTDEEILRTEKIVNAHILGCECANTREMPTDEAMKLGATALFGEKYGKTVRVVRMGDFSAELCGGTHVTNTAEIGLFKILSESSVAAGVRRIEAATGTGVLDILSQNKSLMEAAARELKVQNVNDIVKKAAFLQAEIKNLKREVESLNSELTSAKLDTVLSTAAEIHGVRLAASRLDDISLDAAKNLESKIKSEFPDTVVLLALVSAGKLNFMCVAGKEAVKRGVHAGKLISAVAAVAGGRGGGKPDMAMAGGKDISKTEEALKSAGPILERMLG